MKNAKRTIAQVLLLAVGAVTVATVSVAMAAGPKVCPKIYAPVICDGGKVFVNQCEADKKHATGCVPCSSCL